MTIPEKRLEAPVAEQWIRECLLSQGSAQLTVTGACMAPVLPEGATVRLTPPGKPRVGDVVLLRTANGLRLHRILARIGSSVRSKGDVGSYLDPPAPVSSILGACETGESGATRAGLTASWLVT